MAAYRKTSKLSREDAAYIAGLIDGEGTLSLTRRHRGENRVDRRRDWAEAAGRHRNMDAARRTHQSTVPCQTRQLPRRLIETDQVLHRSRLLIKTPSGCASIQRLAISVGLDMGNGNLSG